MKKEETYHDVLKLLGHEHATIYLEQLQLDKPRYYHANLRVLQRNLQGVSQPIVRKALGICLENRIFNAYEFGQVIRMCKKTDTEASDVNSITINNDNVAYPEQDMQPERSNINVYETLIQ